MRKGTISLLILFASVQFMVAQTNDWAPVGAQWRYDFRDFVFLSAVIQTVTMDTTINGTEAKQLVRNYYDKSLQNIIDRDTFYVANDSGRLYLLRNSTFYKFYDQDWMPGDTVSLPAVDYSCLDTVGRQALIDTGSHTVGSRSYKYHRFYDGPTDEHWQFTSHHYYYLIGGIGGILPTRTCIIDGGGLNLVCYRDSSTPGLFLDPFTYQLMDTTGVCDLYALPVGIKTHNHQNLEGLQIASNPVQDNLMLDIPLTVQEAANHLIIRNLSGQEVITLPLTTTPRKLVDVAGLPSGLYLVEVWGREGLLGKVKFVKR